MKNVKLLFFSVIFYSCAITLPLSESVRQRYSLSDNELKRLQFYTSGDIRLLRAEKEESGKETEQGVLTIKEGKYSEEILIKKGTPGVVTRFFSSDKIGVSFETDDNKFLIFGKPKEGDDRYVLLTLNGKERVPKVKYGDKIYYVVGQDKYVFLLFKMKKLNKIRREQKVVKGRKI